jgi:uncharacterized protein
MNMQNCQQPLSKGPKMLSRTLQSVAFDEQLGRQMRFVAGPRQCGKTTLARVFLSTVHSGELYYNWDQRPVRERYRADAHFFAPEAYDVLRREGRAWICMDEVHKYARWKSILKDFFDSYNDDFRFVVTGSARLDMLHRAGDSLAGRYFLFRLGPLSLRELSSGSPTVGAPARDAAAWIETKLDSSPASHDALAHLLEFGGFPEPFLKADSRFSTLWRREYIDSIVRGELRDLTLIRDLEAVTTLIRLLPERVASPLSINSLARDLECSFATVKGYIRALELTYVVFPLRPYTQRIARAITKERKTYLFDWTHVQDTGKRFENYVAVELRTLLNLWSDSGLGDFDMRYVRTRDGKETDFCLLRDGSPWLLIETKLRREPIEHHHRKNRELLGDIPFVQLVREEGIAQKCEPGLYRISASRLFAATQCPG